MSEPEAPWSQYDQAFKRLHEKLEEILAQLSSIEDVSIFSGTYAPSGSGSTTLITAVSGKTVKVYDFFLWNSGTADVGVRLYFGSSGKSLFKGKLAPKTGAVKSFVRAWKSNAGDSLVFALDAAGTCDYGVGAVQA